MQLVEILKGDSPIILAQPHGGTFIPPELSNRYNENGLLVPDTDWHINKLYDGLLQKVTVVQAKFSRYLIDANRAPSGESLYLGQNNTELCPTIDFHGQSIYRIGMEPDTLEIKKRLNDFHTLYHKAISQQIQRVLKLHGLVLLFDCHSIKSRLPFLFDGVLPDFNIGTNKGMSCDPKIESVAVDVCSNASGYNNVLNGRFKGGWTTRHYGNPKNGIHAIQLELSQRTYMEEHPPWNYVYKKASNLRIHLKNLLICLERILIEF